MLSMSEQLPSSKAQEEDGRAKIIRAEVQYIHGEIGLEEYHAIRDANFINYSSALMNLDRGELTERLIFTPLSHIRRATKPLKDFFKPKTIEETTVYAGDRESPSPLE